MENTQELAQKAVEAATVSATAGKAGGGLATTSGVAALLVENAQLIGSIGVCIGIVLGLAGFVANQYWNYRRQRLLEDEHNRD